MVLLVVSVSSRPSFAYQDQTLTTFNWGEFNKTVQSLNPISHGNSAERTLQRLIYGLPLFYFDAYDQTVKPGIVEYWGEVSPDPKIWILSVKDGIVFLDGSPLRPEDIQFSIDLYKRYTAASGKSYNPHLDKLSKIRVVGSRHVQIHLQGTIEKLPRMLADIPVRSRSYYEGDTFEQTVTNVIEKRPLGFGPYRVRSLIPETSVTLERFFNHYNGPAGFSVIQLKLYQSFDQIKSDFITGKLDFVQIFDIGDIREISSADPSFQIISIPSDLNTKYTLSLNTNYSVLLSRTVRKGILKALNKHRYPISNEQFNIRSVAYGPLPNTSDAFFRNIERIIYNPLAAKNDLLRSGWKDSDDDGIAERNGKTFTLELIYPDNDIYIENLIQYIRFDFSEIGIAIEAQPHSRTELLERIGRGAYQVSLDYFHNYPYDAARSFADYFLYSSGTFHRNLLGVDNPEAIRQLQRAVRLQRQDEAKAIFHRLQELYRRSFAGSALTYQHNYFYAVNNKNITNFFHNGRLLQLSEWEPFNKP